MNNNPKVLDRAVTPKQRYMLIKVIEEAGEMVQAATKILRFGFDNSHPSEPTKSNWGELQREHDDLNDAMYELRRIDLGQK